MIKVLVRLLEGYGLGDGIQMTVVLKHLAKYRPNWLVDYQCRRGAHTAALGLCNQIFTDDSPATGPYDQVIDVHPHDALYNFDDRPNTKVTSTLHDYFALPWDEELGRYTINVPDDVMQKMRRTLPDTPFVILHYMGASSSYKKDLDHWQAEDICAAITAAGRLPLIIDRDKRSPLKVERISPEGADGLAAAIRLAEAYIGVDSGPGHVAAATDTPSMICWTRNHPVHFFDPAPNVCHLVPENHRSLPPADDTGVFEWFDSHYAYDTYIAENGLVAGVYRWLAHILAVTITELPPQVFVMRNDLQSVCWAMTKVRPIAQDRPIDIVLDSERERIADPDLCVFLRSLRFVRSVRSESVWLQDRERATNSRGQFIYQASGRDERGRFRLVPEAALQDNRDMYEWLREYEPDWGWYRHLDETPLPRWIMEGLGEWVSSTASARESASPSLATP